MYSKKVQMERKIVIKCGYKWQLICWILAFLGVNISVVGLQLDSNCYKMNNEKETNDTKFHLTFSFKYGCQYPALHNAHLGDFNASIYGHFPFQCVCLPKCYKFQSMSIATHPKFKQIRAIFEVVLSLDL